MIPCRYKLKGKKAALSFLVIIVFPSIFFQYHFFKHVFTLLMYSSMCRQMVGHQCTIIMLLYDLYCQRSTVALEFEPELSKR